MSYVDDDVAEVRARIAAKVRAQDALIRELVAALTEFLEFGEYAYSHGRDVIAKARSAGYEP